MCTILKMSRSTQLNCQICNYVSPSYNLTYCPKCGIHCAFGIVLSSSPNLESQNSNSTKKVSSYSNLNELTTGLSKSHIDLSRSTTV